MTLSLVELPERIATNIGAILVNPEITALEDLDSFDRDFTSTGACFSHAKN
jgi:hypothetical protein